MNSGCRSAKTDKKGQFRIAGVPLAATIVLGVSGPGYAPTVYPETPASQADKLTIIVSPGDGTVPTEEQVRASAARTPSGELTAEQKAEQERLEKERQEIMAKNAKITERNQLRATLMKEGQEAFNKGDYDVASAKFKEGYESDPEFIGSAPGFLNNWAVSIKKGAVDDYNNAAKSKNSAQISAARIRISKALTMTLVNSLKAHKLASDAPAAEIANAENNKKNIQLSEAIVKDTFRVLGALSMNLASTVGTAEEAAESVDLYKSSLKILPDNSDVLAGLMFSLYMSSSLSGDQGQMQESLNYGAHYLKTAKQDHNQRQAVTEIVELIKGEGLQPKDIR